MALFRANWGVKNILTNARGAGNLVAIRIPLGGGTPTPPTPPTPRPTPSPSQFRFEAIDSNECPANPNLQECTADMACNALCEADRPLPDGQSNFDINNCGGYDVWRKICNGQGITAEPTSKPPTGTPPPAQGVTFVPVTNCPADANLPECTVQTACGDLCEADQPLPDGNTNYDINNCGGYDVFQKTCGGQGTTAEPTPTPTAGTPPPAQGVTFVPVTNCPANADLPECTAQTACGDLCEADQPLPDGNTNFDINNCPGGYDVFQKTCGSQGTTAEPTSTPTAVTPPPAQGATFVPVTNCPANADLPECTAQTACGDLCEADQPLPDGNTNYDINNCGGYDVFQKTCGPSFVPVTNCPANADLPECTTQTACGDLCEADQPLPDGNTNFDINNCGGYDVFQKTCGATFVPVTNCPANADLPECTDQTACGDLCEADQPLPDGNTNYDINNCGGYDVFQKTCGGQGTSEPTPSPTPPAQGGNGKDCPSTGNYLGWCENCMFNAQCPQGGFCCPYMKKCVSSSSHGCFAPIAECRPPYHESTQGYPDSRQCDNSNFPNNWMNYDECMRKSGQAPRLLRL